MLEKEFKYYLDNQEKLVNLYNGKYVVIKDEQVLGAYESEEQAYAEASKVHEVGSFLIQLCTPGKESYTQTFHSRVIF